MASGSDFEQLRSILIYLNERDAIPLLNEATGISIDNAFKDSTETSTRYSYLPTERILDSLGIYLDPDAEDIMDHRNNYFSYYDPNEKVHSYDISDYAHFAALNFNDYERKNLTIGPFKVLFSNTKTELVIAQEDQKEVLTIPMKEGFKRLTSYIDFNSIRDKDLVFVAKNDSIEAELIFTELGFFMEKDSVQINNAKAFLFLKKY